MRLSKLDSSKKYFLKRCISGVSDERWDNKELHYTEKYKPFFEVESFSTA